MERKDLEALVHMALDEAKKQGADQAEVGVSIDSGLSVTARLGDVENLEYTNDRGIGITVYQDSRKGSASTTDISAEAIREAVTKACTFATVTAKDPCSGLADADLMCTDPQDLDLDYPWTIDASDAISMAIECEAKALEFDSRITNSEGASVSSNRGTSAYGNSHGFIGSLTKTSHSLSCVVLGSADGQMQRDYYYSSARDAAELVQRLLAEGESPQRLLMLVARQYRALDVAEGVEHEGPGTAQLRLGPLQLVLEARTLGYGGVCTHPRLGLGVLGD